MGRLYPKSLLRGLDETPVAKGQHMDELLVDGSHLAAKDLVQRLGLCVHHGPAPG